jgi:hypothetical protein
MTHAHDPKLSEMAFREVVILFVNLIVRAAAAVLGDTSSITSTPTAILPDAGPSMSTFTSAPTATANATADTGGTASASSLQTSSTVLLAAIIPIGAVPITMEAVLVRMHRNCRDLQPDVSELAAEVEN